MTTHCDKSFLKFVIDYPYFLDKNDPIKPIDQLHYLPKMIIDFNQEYLDIAVDPPDLGMHIMLLGSSYLLRTVTSI